MTILTANVTVVKLEVLMMGMIKNNYVDDDGGGVVDGGDDKDDNDIIIVRVEVLEMMKRRIMNASPQCA